MYILALETVHEQLLSIVTSDDALWITQNLSRWRYAFQDCEVLADNGIINVSWSIPTGVAEYTTKISYQVSNLESYNEPTESILIHEPAVFFRELFTTDEQLLIANSNLYIEILTPFSNISQLVPMGNVFCNYGKYLENLSVIHKHDIINQNNTLNTTFDVLPEVQCKIHIDFNDSTKNFVQITDHYWQSIDVFLTYLSDRCY